MVRESPGMSVPSSHAKGVVQAPAFIWKRSPSGVGSLTATSVAADGPELDTTILYSTVLPGITTAGPVLVMLRLALDVIVSVSVAEADRGSPKPGGFSAVTVLTTWPIASGATVAFNENVATAFTGSDTVV